jgi:hypothetical protein
MILPEISGANLTKIAAAFELPEYVKTADPESLAPPSLSPQYFAQRLPQLRYPTHNKAACWLSFASFALDAEENNRTNPTVKDRLMKSACYFGIIDDLTASISQYKQAMDKAAASSIKYPVRNAKEARAAQQWLIKAAGTKAIDAIDAHDLATRITATLQSETDPRITKIAGFGGVSDLEGFSRAVGGRLVFDGFETDNATMLMTQKFATVVLDKEDLIEINESLPEIVKAACQIRPDGAPWDDIIQHDEPVYPFAGGFYKQSEFANIPGKFLQYIELENFFGPSRIKEIAKKANQIPVELQKAAAADMKPESCKKCKNSVGSCACKKDDKSNNKSESRVQTKKAPGSTVLQALLIDSLGSDAVD